MDTIIRVSNLSVSYGEKRIFDKISFSFSAGQLVGIIGPNGAGKSTLIKAILGLLNPDEGTIEIQGQPLHKAKRQIAYVPQRSAIDLNFPARVEDVVMMGRYPHIDWWKRPGPRDYDIVDECLEKVGMLLYRKRQIGQLSGGQLQRVFLARALAQEAEILFLDEPFTGIDITSENLIMGLLRRLRDGGKTIFVVNHDLSKAEAYFDSLMLLNQKLIACGRKEEVFRADCLREGYDGKVLSLGDLLVVNG